MYMRPQRWVKDIVSSRPCNDILSCVSLIFTNEGMILDEYLYTVICATLQDGLF